MEIFKNLTKPSMIDRAEAYADIFGLSSLLYSALISEGKTCYQSSNNGSTKKPTKFFTDKLISLGFEQKYYYVDANLKNKHIKSLWSSKDSVADVTGVDGATIEISIVSHNQEVIKEILEFIKPHLYIPKVRQRGYVYSIVQSMRGLDFHAVGYGSVPLVRSNYSKKVLEDYDYIVNDLNSDSPSGRISILEGLPGTGKTHIVRALLGDIKNSLVVLVNPDMVKELAGPNLLPLLLRQQSISNKSITLILEDADKCLVARKDSNDTSIIQSLLNLSDGILGSLLDIRVVATTNAKTFTIDPAILRPGRLSKRIAVGSLTKKEAQNTFKNILPSFKGSPITKASTLAEIYSLAREKGWLPKSKKEKSSKVKGVDISEETSYDEVYLD